MQDKGSYVLILILLLINFTLPASTSDSLVLSYEEGVTVKSYIDQHGVPVKFTSSLPLFTVELDGRNYSSKTFPVSPTVNGFVQAIDNKLQVNFSVARVDSLMGYAASISLKNTSGRVISLGEIVPFGKKNCDVCISWLNEEGTYSLYRRKQLPVSVSLALDPSEISYSSIKGSNEKSIYGVFRGITRDENSELVERKILPGTSIVYSFQVESFQGAWQQGLKQAFTRRALYYLNSYVKKEVKNPRDNPGDYISVMQFAWDHSFYGAYKNKYNFFHFLEMGEQLFGGIDIFGLWSAWPRLGLDERTQVELYSDLPYGIEKIAELSNYANNQATKFLIAYSTWDDKHTTSQRINSVENLISSTKSCGIILDTRGTPRDEIKDYLKLSRKDHMIYPYMMPHVEDMHYLVIGRLNRTSEFHSLLNLSKLIEPGITFFSALTPGEKDMQREIATSFFNGHGVELNMLLPGRNEYMNNDYHFLSKTTRILRENSNNFHSPGWIPLVPTSNEKVWVNKWPLEEKTLYTIFSLSPAGHDGILFKEDFEENYHHVDLYNHQEIQMKRIKDETWLPAFISPFSSSFTSTGKEGQVGCIARFRKILSVNTLDDSMYIKAAEGDEIRIWDRSPAYGVPFKKIDGNKGNISLSNDFPMNSGKFVIQLFKGSELIDELIVKVKAGNAWLISENESSPTAKYPPYNMVEIPEGIYVFSANPPEDNFIPYPDNANQRIVKMSRFYIDRYPVTNAQFYDFLVATGYKPDQFKNFLKHWENNIYPRGQENYPVVYVSYEDAQAYAEWSKKRLPTEEEWQYAAQGNTGNKWPWGDEFHATKCNNAFGRPTPVDAFPKGANQFGVEDLVGNVWQMTNDVYDNGHYYYIMLKGGSYYEPRSSKYYITGGALPVEHRQILPRISNGHERSATVGFRCVKDATQ